MQNILKISLEIIPVLLFNFTLRAACNQWHFQTLTPKDLKCHMWMYLLIWCKQKIASYFQATCLHLLQHSSFLPPNPVFFHLHFIKPNAQLLKYHVTYFYTGKYKGLLWINSVCQTRGKWTNRKILLKLETSLVAQLLRLHAPSAGGPKFDPWWEN